MMNHPILGWKIHIVVKTLDLKEDLRETMVVSLESRGLV